MPADLQKRYDDALNDLHQHPGGTGAYHEVLAEAAELSGALTDAVAELESAIGIDSRFELRIKRWSLMSHDKNMAAYAISELELFKSDPKQAIFRDANIKSLLEIFVTAMAQGVHSPQRINKFAAPLGSRDIGAIISRVRRREREKQNS